MDNYCGNVDIMGVCKLVGRRLLAGGGDAKKVWPFIIITDTTTIDRSKRGGSVDQECWATSGLVVPLVVLWN